MNLPGLLTVFVKLSNQVARMLDNDQQVVEDQKVFKEKIQNISRGKVKKGFVSVH